RLVRSPHQAAGHRVAAGHRGAADDSGAARNTAPRLDRGGRHRRRARRRRREHHNCWIERDRDQLMKRTHGRPLPQGEIVPARALAFGIILNIVAFALLASAANLLAATLTLSATLFYVFVYTLWLKPRTVHNIVISVAAGAVPALVGWAAVRNGLGAPAWLLFAIVFFWTPAHFWALAMKYRDDYAAAGVPMLPVVHGVELTTRRIAAYATITVALTF